jgi:succinate-semialdehyde dehydrogenase / glutarate-semialdehyde dehydrogenase
MRNAADILNRNARDYAKLMAEEMGKPLLDGAWKSRISRP